MSARRGQFNWAAIFVVTVRLTGWLTVNALAAAGIIAVIAFAIGSFSLPLTMAQLANLADRYVAANAARQGQFNQIMTCGFAAAFLGVSFFRRAGFARALESTDHA
ncbi:hypothetical protein [Novosphingobium sp. Fuku2-ISO-50]|uniref:hypothetical protein n=1 Tax=Novosphingobium sp. Fuku2-ISO-50 TaxID=1739114 RepID=UPI00076C66A9|nr:hypothetical protein [Novosphingobium sp. Fuku2-ISO-50]KUR75343.1 hypothetical protein AQZ50_15920 [Novosphingobium sp. Fuku2-ISO-50]